mgnify:CR=1 FL=1
MYQLFCLAVAYMFKSISWFCFHLSIRQHDAMCCLIVVLQASSTFNRLCLDNWHFHMFIFSKCIKMFKSMYFMSQTPQQRCTTCNLTYARWDECQWQAELPPQILQCSSYNHRTSPIGGATQDTSEHIQHNS